MDNEEPQKLYIELIEGVRLEVDPTKWDVVGIPLKVGMAQQPSRIQFDMGVFVTPAGQESKVVNMATFSKARR